MITRKIRLPLDQTVKRYLSAGTYNQAVGQSLDFLDDVYSYFFRYPWLLEQIEGTENTQGAPIDFMSSHPVAAVGLTLVCGAAAVALSIDAARKRDKAAEMKAGDYQDSYTLIQDRLQEKDKRTESLNQCIAALLNKNASLKKKYKAIIITPDNQVEFTLQEEKQEAEPAFWTQAKNKVRSWLFSSWVMLSICSYAYWLLWIGVGVITGHFASSSVEGLGAAGFAVPLAVGALYPLLKICNWYRKKCGKKIEDQPVVEQEPRVQIEENPRVLLQAGAEISQLFKMAILANEKARLTVALDGFGGVVANASAEEKADEQAMSGDESILSLGQGKWKKAAMTGLSTAISTYINAQYGAIFIVDILNAAGVVVNVAALSLGVGIAFIACSGLYGIYKAVQKYKEVQKYQAEIVEQNITLENSTNTLEVNYQNKMDEIKRLKAAVRSLAQGDDENWLQQQFEQFERSTVVSLPEREADDLSTWSKVKRCCAQSYAVVGGTLLGIFHGMKSGLMIARIATVVGTVLFVPCAVAMLATPWTLAILVTSAVVYGLFKGYEYYQKHQEKQAKVLLEQRAGKVELLKEQCAIADLQISLLVAKQTEQKQKRAAAPVLTEEKLAPQQQLLPRLQSYDDENGLRKKNEFHYADSGPLQFQKYSKDDLDVDKSAVSAAFLYELAASRPG